MLLQEKTLTIVGAQRSGQALAKLILKLGGRVKITDMASQDSLDQEFYAWAKENGVDFEHDQHTQAFLGASDLVILSPGVSFQSQVAQWARELHIPLMGEIEFAFQYCEKPVIAVTGSNGKTTTVHLIRDIINASGQRAILCGNVGTPFSEFVLDLDDVDYVVVEVSSFQLEMLIEKQDHEALVDVQGFAEVARFQPKVGVLLNVSQNHLDRHKDITDYFESKARIFMNQTANDFAVLNGNDDLVMTLKDKLAANVLLFNNSESIREFGNLNPNQSAVCRVAQAIGIDQSVCEEVFDQFKGVEHRLEWVREIHGVDYINDSKATTAEAARWALNHYDRPVVMICGGRDKNIDFSVLKDIVKDKVKAMVVIGEAKEKIRETFAGMIAIETCDFLDKAVLKAKSLASTGDYVVFTPMCTSFDMFKNFEVRGEEFKKIVKNL